MGYKDLEKQYKWNSEYTKKNYKPVSLRLRYDNDNDVIEHLAAIKESGLSVNEYMINLIRKDMGK